MSVIRLIAPALMCAAVATPVFADVTLRLKGIQGLAGDQQSEITEYRKGLKWRMDHTSNGLSSSLIRDASTGTWVMLWPNSKRADVIDSSRMSESFAQTGVPETSYSIMPTGQSRQIAGSTCTVYHVKASFAYPEMERGQAMTMVMEGSTCLVKNGPGQGGFHGVPSGKREKRGGARSKARDEPADGGPWRALRYGDDNRPRGRRANGRDEGDRHPHDRGQLGLDGSHT
jgi:hypothetical protein